MGKRLSTNDFSNLFEGGPDKPISGSINRQFVKAAGHLPSIKQLMPLCI
jgi:hypothetical protein